MLENTKTLFGQPRGLYVIVMADLWGRFGYAGMKAILIYYLTQTLSISQSRTSLLFGTFTSLLLMMPLPCGIIADRYLGRRRSVLMGAGLMCVGNLMLVFPALIYPALAMLAFGTGLFQSCLPSQVMSLYKNDEAGAAIGFNYYYIGLNIGALLGGICCGAIGEYYGWKWGFALASLGMLPAMTSFMIGRKYLSEEPVPTRDKMASGRNSIKFNNINVPVFIGFIVALILLVMTYEQCSIRWHFGSLKMSIGTSDSIESQ